MVKSEISKIIYAKKTKLIFSMILGIMIIDLIIGFLGSRSGRELLSGNFQLPDKFDYHPTMAAFLSGVSTGHITQMLIIWLLPIILLWLVGDSNIREKKCGYNNFESCRYDKIKMIYDKLIASFIVSFMLVFIPIVMNFILANIIYFRGDFFKGLDVMKGLGYLDSLEIRNPYVTYIIYILFFSIISGLIGIFCTALSIIVPKYKVVYPMAFIFWSFLWITEINLGSVVQPFTCEITYRLKHSIVALCIFLIGIIIVSSTAFIIKVRNDEI